MKTRLLFTLVLSLGCLQPIHTITEKEEELLYTFVTPPALASVITRLLFKNFDKPQLRQTLGVTISALLAGLTNEKLQRDKVVRQVSQHPDTENKNPFHVIGFAIGALGAVVSYTIIDSSIELALYGARRINLLS